MQQEEAQDESWEDFIESIASDVMACLSRDGFFARLEKRVWPNGPEGPKVCGNSYETTFELTAADGYPPEDQEEIIGVMRSRGGFCDCEIMLNVAPNCEFRERYWKRKAEELEAKQ